MKSYLVLVEAEDYINVDAENDEEAIEKAIEIISGDFTSEWKGRVMHSEELEDEG